MGLSDPRESERQRELKAGGPNPDPPYQCRPLGGCVWILTLWGLLFFGGGNAFYSPV